jgi:hypothetical protein
VSTFKDPNLGVFTSGRVLHDGSPVLLVFHEQDGDWQFLSSLEADASEVLHIHLSHLLGADGTLGEVADLPLGWKAWRLSVGEEWIREPTPDDQGSL